MTQASKRIQYEAVHWATKVRLGPLAPKENAQLQQWLQADPRHRGAYIRANVMHVAVERVATLSAGSVPTPLIAAPPGAVQRFFRTAKARRWLIAASIAAVAVSFGWNNYQDSHRRYVSGIGELRQVALDDGSSMLLNTATKAVVRLSDQAREVELAQGEALFDVAKDPNRPFSVRAGNITIKAIGTAFAVRHFDRRIEVTVEEGTVDLVPESGASVQRLTADQHAVVEKTQPIVIEALSRGETDRQLAWRTGRLEFDGQPLSEAVNEMNRHNRRQIVVADVRLARKPVVGLFRSTDAKAFASIAAAALQARVIDDGTIIRIEPRIVE